MQQSLRQWLMLCICGACFVLSTVQLKGESRAVVASEIEVALPMFVQVAMFGGDRYMAANLATIRALVTNTSAMKPSEYAILAQVQKDAAWLNPAHEDNYYIASAILPWNGELAAAQDILRKASVARPYDYQPSFLYAFHLYYFEQKPMLAAEWLRDAAIRLPDDDDRLALQNVAAKWADKGKDLDSAIAIVTALAKQAKRKDFRAYLETRVQRLQDLKLLRTNTELFKQRQGRELKSLDELVTYGLLSSLPKDPFGFGYELDAAGQVQFSKAGP